MKRIGGADLVVGDGSLPDLSGRLEKNSKNSYKSAIRDSGIDVVTVRKPRHTILSTESSEVMKLQRRSAKDSRRPTIRSV